jgi:tRNA-specific 2-thiouridylase
MASKRVLVAMSGGVDSSVSAALLKEAGYEVIGVTMQIWPPDKAAFGGCCGVVVAEDARKVAHKLGLPHYVMDFGDVFADTVIDDFCREYGAGRTPNPCTRCNQYVKFGALLDKMKGLDADFLATGHYARVGPTPGGYRLLRAADRTKDQSYFLYTLGQEELKRLLLPLGNLRKTEVRKLAAKLGLSVSAKPDSQDVCFVDNDYRTFLAGRLAFEPGDIVDTEGRVLGRHSGLARYTVGQRQGLGLAAGCRLYVLKLDTAGNRLVVGSRERLSSKGLIADRLSWVSGKGYEGTVDVTVKIRHRSSEAAARLSVNNGLAEVIFHEPQWAVAPGQSVVFYQGDFVLGGGVIRRAGTDAY